MRRRPTVSELRAALWALRAIRRTRRQLRRTGYEALNLPGVPSLPDDSTRGVHAILRRLSPTCLERAVVLQRWRAAHGDPREVVVGVSGTQETFRAHAWLEDESPTAEIGAFREIVRLRP